MTPTRELWRAVPGHEGSYEVSDQGRVRSLDRVVHDRMGRDRFWPGRVLKLQPLKKNGGRHVVLLREHSGGDLWIVARLVLTAFIGPAPDGMEACHGNGICTDDRLENLRWDTRRENVLDQVRHGVHYEARQSECKWGHPLSGLNARPHRRKNGRICRACAAARAKAQYDAQRGLPAVDHKDLSDAYYRRFTKGVA